MNKAGFYLVYIPLRLLALLPYWALYGIADLVYFAIYYLIGYRRNVVRENLIRSFPAQDEHWFLQTEKRFYKNLSQIIVENIKLLHVDPQVLKNRFTFENVNVLHELSASGKSVFISLGHSGNWETIVHALSFSVDLPVIAIYKKVSNPVFEDFIKNLRTRWGKIRMIESQSAYRQLSSVKTQPHLIALLGDQTPPGTENDYWTIFLNQETPFFTGLEKMSKALGHAVVFMESERTSKGRYIVRFSEICEDPKGTSQNEIIGEYVRLLEKSIEHQPDNWLWSHRRWKHKRPSS